MFSSIGGRAEVANLEAHLLSFLRKPRLGCLERKRQRSQQQDARNSFGQTSGLILRHPMSFRNTSLFRVSAQRAVSRSER